MNQSTPSGKNQRPAGGDVEKASPPVITVDLSVYDHFLDDVDLSEADREAFLEILWNIITEFVSLGFGVHPLQQAQKDGDMERTKPNKSTLALSSMVHSDHTIIDHEPVTPVISQSNSDDSRSDHKSEQSREDQ